MTLLHLASRSLASRRLTSAITVISIALSVALLVGVSHLRRSARDSFTGVISQTDLIVGPRGGSVQLLMYAVFHMGAPTANIDYDRYQEIARHPAVAWTIPLSLGDSHRGFRVVGTSGAFFQHYRHHGGQALELAEGSAPEGVWEAAIGAQVARELGYRIGQPLVVTHGISSVGITDHDDKPFVLAGILAPTGTPIDRSVYITLEGFEAMHIDWEAGAPPRPGERTPKEQIDPAAIRVDEISAFLVGTSSRIETLALQREINTLSGSPLMAIIPGVTLSELWRVVGYAETALLLVSAFVVVIGLLGMLMTIFTSLDARRREMAILRALGSGRGTITSLLLLEAGLLSTAGAALGLGLVFALTAALRPLVRSEFGLELSAAALGGFELAVVAVVIVAGTAMGLPPAVKAYRDALSDGLTVQR